MKTAIIIPVYNHEQLVAEVIRQALDLPFPVIVVDDGSTDGTADRVRQMDGITVITHPVNRGKGAALLSGFAAALEKQCVWAVTIDADGQHIPEDLRLLLTAVETGERCLVVGKRRGMEAGGNVPWTSRFGRGFSNFWVRVSGGPNLEDSQSGFRLYPLPEILALGVRARRYQFEVEVLVRAHRARIPIREVPVRVVYQVPGGRVSHFRPWVDFMRNSQTFARLFISQLIDRTLGR